MANERLAYFDNVKGFLILMVVLGHLLSYLPTGSHLLITAQYWIYTFHMPLFIFVSGIFAAKTYTKENGFKAENVLFYLALCFVFWTLGVAESIAWKGFENVNLWNLNFFDLSSGRWYLFAMAEFALMTPFLGRVKPKFGIGFTVLFAVLAGFWVPSSAKALFSCLRFFTYLPIFAAGYYIGVKRASGWVKGLLANPNYNTLRIASVAVLVAWFLALYFMPDECSAFIKKLCTGFNTYAQMSKYLALSDLGFICARLAFFAGTIVVGFAVACIMPVKRTPFTLWGERSLQIYIAHLLLVYAIHHYGLNEYMLSVSHLWTWSPFILAIPLTALLAAPRFPVTWTAKLKELCKRAVS